MIETPYRIDMKRKVEKTAAKMPRAMQERLAVLIDDLQEKGPILSDWPNFSSLGKDKYHCHLGYKWVACWRWEEGTIIIEVYYAGSRENAPY